MKTSLQIASAARLDPIGTVAERAGIPERFVEHHGRSRAKIDLNVLAELRDRPLGKYILVTAITPTPLGEGKTTTTIGLGMALSKLGKNAAISLRQSSMGPVFGIKGGGAGGGYAQVVPLEESVLHLNGDFHALALAHNQIAAMTDNSWYHGNPLDIDPERIQIRRVMDVNDRFLRDITIGQGGKANGEPRQAGFDIVAASELMAILALVAGRDGVDALKNLRARLGHMVVAFDRQGTPITADDIKAAGAATVIMRETLKPNLMQTIENTPAFIHAGPFGNIAHGNSSILADQIALRVADYVVTESGFGADMGAEKFFNIKCRASGLWPAAAVVVATVRALKSQTGKYKITPGKPLPPELLAENPDDVYAGGANLSKQIANVRRLACRWWWRSTPFPTTSLPRSPPSVRLPWQPAQSIWRSARSLPMAARAGWSWRAWSSRRRRQGIRRRHSSTRLNHRSNIRSTRLRPRSMGPPMSASARRPSSRSARMRRTASVICRSVWLKHT